MCIRDRDRGDEVCQRLSRARSGLDEQGALVEQRRFHGFGHRELPFAELVARQDALERRPRTEHVPNADGHPMRIPYKVAWIAPRMYDPRVPSRSPPAST